MTRTPEDEARDQIDAMLDTAGWAVQDAARANIHFWLKDDSLEDSDNLPAPAVIAAEIVEDLRAALEQFEAIAEDLNGRPHP